MPIPTEYAKPFIHEHLHEIRSPRDVAAHMGYSYNTLRKDFKRQERITLGSFITKVRVERAKQILVETDLRSFETAYVVGFSREEVAAHVFKRETGISMQEFRGNIRSSKRDTADRTTQQAIEINREDQPRKSTI